MVVMEPNSCSCSSRIDYISSHHQLKKKSTNKEQFALEFVSAPSSKMGTPPLRPHTDDTITGYSRNRGCPQGPSSTHSLTHTHQILLPAALAFDTVGC